MKSALQLPKLNLTTCETHVKLEKVFDKIRESKNVLVFLGTEVKQEFKLLYSGFGEEEFLMMSILLFRHIELFNFFKLLILDVEKNRQVPCEEHDFTYKALEYIRLNKLINLDLNI